MPVHPHFRVGQLVVARRPTSGRLFAGLQAHRSESLRTAIPDNFSGTSCRAQSVCVTSLHVLLEVGQWGIEVGSHPELGFPVATRLGRV